MASGLDKIGPEALEEVGQKLNAGAGGVALQVLPIINIIAGAIAAVRWHRFVLLGEGANGTPGQVQPVRKEDGKYLWSLLKVTLIAALAVMLAIGIIAGIIAASKMLDGNQVLIAPVTLISFVGYFWAIGLFLRLSLALPDAAMGGEGKVFALFARSAGNTWALAGALLLIGLVAFGGVILWALISYAVISAGASLISILIVAMLYLIFSFFFLMTQITLLSVAYREIIGLPSNGASEV
tara:strand:- start:1524 stop:2240 length:717 start_codon:yes stop_codon:yes gene_type:complete